jgi:hypothetical protein
MILWYHEFGEFTQGNSKMSTATTDPRSTAALPETITVAGEERHVMRGATWRFYDWLTDALGERAPFRVVYDGKSQSDMQHMVASAGKREVLPTPAEAPARQFDLVASSTGSRRPTSSTRKLV